jgi:hypothetical protein
MGNAAYKFVEEELNERKFLDCFKKVTYSVSK